MKLSTDKPMPAFLKVGEAAKIIRGEDTPSNRKFIHKLIRSKQLRVGTGGKKRGSTIYIKACSVRELVA